MANLYIKQRVIKRYSNRKMYDTTTHSYITLDEIAQLARSGNCFRIICNKTNEDLTKKTILSAILQKRMDKIERESTENLIVELASLP